MREFEELRAAHRQALFGAFLLGAITGMLFVAAVLLIFWR